MKPVLEVTQAFYSHLWYGGRDTLLHVGIACLKWGGGLAVLGCLGPCWRNGWRTVRLDDVFILFGIGFAFRFLDEGSSRQLIVEQTGLHLMVGPGSMYGKHYSSSEVREFLVKLVAPGRLLVRIKWTDENRKTTTICGKVRNPQEELKRLAEFYSVVDETLEN